MKRLTPATLTAELLTAVQRGTPAQQLRRWENGTARANEFKRDLTAALLVIQSRRCGYCGIRLLGEQHHRDHIAGKSAYPQFTFRVNNLVLACFYCNGECKGKKDTVSKVDPDYDQSEFVIVHPYLDDPKEHLLFFGKGLKVLVTEVKDSSKGRETITMFDLASAERSKMRVKDALFDKDLDHLHGKWKHLLEAVVFAPIPLRIIMKLRP